MSGMVVNVVCNHCGATSVCHVWNGDKVSFDHHCPGVQEHEDGKVRLGFEPERPVF